MYDPCMNMIIVVFQPGLGGCKLATILLKNAPIVEMRFTIQD